MKKNLLRATALLPALLLVAAVALSPAGAALQQSSPTSEIPLDDGDSVDSGDTTVSSPTTSAPPVEGTFSSPCVSTRKYFEITGWLFTSRRMRRAISAARIVSS